MVETKVRIEGNRKLSIRKLSCTLLSVTWELKVYNF